MTFLKLPFVWAACDGVPQPGTVAFRPSTTLAFLRDMGRSLAAQGFQNVMVSNLHGSPRHFPAIEMACDRISRECGSRMVSLFSLMLSRLNGRGSELGGVLGHLPGVTPPDFAGDTHGGLVETSQLLALHPEWVDPDYKSLPRSVVGAKKGKGFLAMVRGFKAWIAYFTRTSYAGAPAKASAQLGQQILDTLASRTAEAITETLDGTLPREQWHSPYWKMRHILVSPLAVRFFDRVPRVPKTLG